MLVVDNIHAYYGDSHVLHGVSLSVAPGQVCTLLGRNGAGKTTTLLSIMGFLVPRQGHVTLDKQLVIGLPPHRISKMGLGFVPQERGVFPSLTVEENLTVAARKGRWNLREIYQLFPRLEERSRNLGFQLSGGEQQMLSIARALMLNPSLLLLDEPSEGLAPLIVREIVQILHKLKTDGLGILLIEQNLGVALELADLHHVLSKGEVCFRGTTAELQRNEEILSTHLSV